MDSNTFLNIFGSFKMLTKSGLLDLLLITKTRFKNQKNKTIFNEIAFYISQPFRNPKFPFESVGHQIFELLVGPKRTSIAIVVNKNGKQDGGFSINLK